MGSCALCPGQRGRATLGPRYQRSLSGDVSQGTFLGPGDPDGLELERARHQRGTAAAS